MEKIYKLLVKTLSPVEVQRLGKKFGLDIPIVMYDEIINSDHLDELFDKYPNGFIVFYPSYVKTNGKNRHLDGHYVCMFKKDHTVYYFDSYGSLPDSIKKMVPQRDELYKENINSLIDLLYRSHYHIDYNNHKFQKITNDAGTCGRWCIFRLFYHDFNADQFHKEVKRLCNKFNLDGDELVSVIVS